MATETQKEVEAIPSVKDLASSEPTLRRKNLDEIIAHLENRSPSNYLTHTQALQLWRGFHVALYMHDSKNQLSVQKLIATLASTFKIIRSKDIELSSSKPNSESQAENGKFESTKATGTKDEDEFTGFDDDSETTTPAQPSPPELDTTSWLSVYSTAFWETIAREWSGIDQWRINKYLLLVRFVLRELFTICLSSYFNVETKDEPSTAPPPTPNSKKRKGASGDDSAVSKKSKKNNLSSQHRHTTTIEPSHSQLAILATHPLSPRSRATSDGLRLHMLDIYLDEMATALTSIVARLTMTQKSAETGKAVSEVFLAPVRGIAADGLAKHVRVKAKEVVAEFEGVWMGVVGDE